MSDRGVQIAARHADLRTIVRHVAGSAGSPHGFLDDFERAGSS